MHNVETIYMSPFLCANSIWKYFLKYECFTGITHTGKLLYLEFQGNGENTSSFPKFEIANNDVHFRLNTLLDRFLNGILARKRHFRGAFSAH